MKKTVAVGIFRSSFKIGDQDIFDCFVRDGYSGSFRDPRLGSFTYGKFGMATVNGGDHENQDFAIGVPDINRFIVGDGVSDAEDVHSTIRAIAPVLSMSSIASMIEEANDIGLRQNCEKASLCLAGIEFQSPVEGDVQAEIEPTAISSDAMGKIKEFLKSEILAGYNLVCFHSDNYQIPPSVLTALNALKTAQDVDTFIDDLVAHHHENNVLLQCFPRDREDLFFSTDTVSVSPGDLVYVCSDGVGDVLYPEDVFNRFQSDKKDIDNTMWALGNFFEGYCTRRNEFKYEGERKNPEFSGKRPDYSKKPYSLKNLYDITPKKPPKVDDRTLVLTHIEHAATMRVTWVGDCSVCVLGPDGKVKYQNDLSQHNVADAWAAGLRRTVANFIG